MDVLAPALEEKKAASTSLSQDRWRGATFAGLKRWNASGLTLRRHSGTSTMDRSWTPGLPRPRRLRMRSRLYLSTLAAASLLGSTLIASAQGPANSAADSTATIPGTSVPADSGPIIGSEATGHSMPSEITTGSATDLHPGKAKQPATTNSVTPTPAAGPTTSGPTGNIR
jgi:hypothetical protein